MTSRALVIGVGAYSRPEWELPAAVPDALRFTDWVVRHGGVAPADVRLLLSPWPEHLLGYPTRDAGRRSIVTAIQEFQDGAGRGGDRLYFYYAGHGVSAPDVTTGGIQEPVIIPADVTSLRVDAGLLIGFSEIMPALLSWEPREQSSSSTRAGTSPWRTTTNLGWVARESGGARQTRTRARAAPSTCCIRLHRG